jgi:hypothetical protein
MPIKMLAEVLGSDATQGAYHPPIHPPTRKPPPTLPTHPKPSHIHRLKRAARAHPRGRGRAGASGATEPLAMGPAHAGDRLARAVLCPRAIVWSLAHGGAAQHRALASTCTLLLAFNDSRPLLTDITHQPQSPHPLPRPPSFPPRRPRSRWACCCLSLCCSLPSRGGGGRPGKQKLLLLLL